MDVWEYKIESCPNAYNAQKKLDERGEEGWELVSVLENHGVFKLFFKRKRKTNDVLKD